MGHACCHDEHLGEHKDPEHPVVAIVAIIAIVAAMLLITWVRLEVHGTEDIEEAISELATQRDEPPAPKPDYRPQEEREVDAAVTSSRFATGFSP